MKKLFPRLLIFAVVISALVFVVRNRAKASVEFQGYTGYGEGELVFIASPIGGQLKSLTVARGDDATKDEILFSLDQTEETAMRAEAEETLRESRTRQDKALNDFNRAKSLRDKRVISPEDFDLFEQTLLGTQHNVAGRQRALDQADWRLNQKQQSAPEAGLVYDTYYRPGEWVPAGSPVVSLLPPEYRKVRFFVPESDLGKVQVGSPIEIFSDGLNTSLPGRVSFVSSTAEYTLPIIYSRENRHKLVFLVEGNLDPENAKKINPGAPVEVRLQTTP